MLAILVLVIVVSAVLLLVDQGLRVYRLERKVSRLHKEIELAWPSWDLDRAA